MHCADPESVFVGNGSLQVLDLVARHLLGATGCDVVVEAPDLRSGARATCAGTDTLIAACFEHQPCPGQGTLMRMGCRTRHNPRQVRRLAPSLTIMAAVAGTAGPPI
jgi:hypothetical protein